MFGFFLHVFEIHLCRLLYVSVILFFVLLSNIPSYECITVGLSIRELMDI